MTGSIWFKPVLGLLAVFLMFIAVPLCSNAEPEFKEFNVGSYNIRHGRGTDDEVNLDRIAGVLGRARLDLIALQEVDFNVQRSGHIDQAKALADQLSLKSGRNWRSIAAPAIEFDGGQYGNAVLFDADKFQLLASYTLKLPGHVDGDGQRSAAILSLKFGCSIFQFVASHFSHLNTEELTAPSLHERSVELLHSSINPDRPTLLAADVNDDGSETHGALRHFQALDWAIFTPQAETTLVGKSMVIDHFAAFPGEAITIDDLEVISNKITEIASDHYPITARPKVSCHHKRRL